MSKVSLKSNRLSKPAVLSKPTALVAIWVFLAALSALGLLMAARQPTAAAAQRAPEPPNRFVGNAACQPCHAGECKLHAASRHAITLRLPDQRELGAKMPPAGRVPGTDIVLVEGSGNIGVALAGVKSKPLPVNLAFGSGKTGMTYVVIVGAQLFELHKSYFPGLRKWFLTPGHEHQKPTDVGMMYKPDTARQCVGCHSVTVPANSLQPERQFFGVGCESCHGAGGAHVDAMKAGRRGDLKMEDLSRLDATHLMERCAKCHRGRDTIDLKSSQAKMTNRFQPYGVMKSRCFLKSGNKLSCLNCHNPHADASTNSRAYAAICQTCHSSSARVTARTVRASVCPVNRTAGCVGCHMPKRPVFTDTYMPTEMADHYIRVYPKKR